METLAHVFNQTVVFRGVIINESQETKPSTGEIQYKNASANPRFSNIRAMNSGSICELPYYVSC